MVSFPQSHHEASMLAKERLDADVKRQVKTFAKTMKNQPGFEHLLADLQLCGSDDEASNRETGREQDIVPSAASLLAAIDQEEPRSMALKRLVYSEKKDPSRDFLGSALDMASDGSTRGLRGQKSSQFDTPASLLDHANGSSFSSSKVYQQKQHMKSLHDATEMPFGKGWTPFNNPRYVRLINFLAEGSASQQCNGVYRFDGHHKGKPLFKNESDAIIYFNEKWKMNSHFKITAWLYECDIQCLLPPEGSWTSTRSTGPIVSMKGDLLKVVAAKEGHLLLEDGQSLPTTLEGKSWRWSEPESKAKRTGRFDDALKKVQATGLVKETQGVQAQRNGRFTASLQQQAKSESHGEMAEPGARRLGTSKWT
jgi:hypothetical protein